MKKKALGRGLSALIPDSYIDDIAKDNMISERAEVGDGAKGLLEIDIDIIIPNQDQPRLRFEEEKLEELVLSIQSAGILQPLIVKEIEINKYELICGERRFRAAQKAGLKKVPVVVKDTSDANLLELALIENIQREDLSAVEEAEAYMKLHERGYSHEEIAKKVGKSRTTIVNTMRLLKLPKEILNLVLNRKISEGHARALLGLLNKDEQISLAKRIIAEGLSVRDIEEIVKNKTYKKRSAKKIKKIDAQILDLQRKMEERLGSKVRIFAGKSKGRIEIKYFSLDDLDRILNVLGVEAN